MNEDLSKTKKKRKAGPLKSSPGFLKCMRNVYLYFKEEKEKGALNIPINSFIEMTAVACGVGRKTLYNYAKKGLFDDHPTILHQKQKKKKIKNNTLDGSQELSKKCLVAHEPVIITPKKRHISIQVQTQQNKLGLSVATSDTPDTTPNNRLKETIMKDEFSESKIEEASSNHWTGGSARRDISYFTKSNNWQNVYTIPNTDVSSCSNNLTASRIANSEPANSDLTNL